MANSCEGSQTPQNLQDSDVYLKARTEFLSLGLQIAASLAWKWRMPEETNWIHITAAHRAALAVSTGRVQTITSPAAYYRAVATNVVREDARERTRREKVHDLKEPEVIENTALLADKTAEQLDTNEVMAWLFHEVRLTERQRLILLVLVDCGGEPKAEDWRQAGFDPENGKKSACKLRTVLKRRFEERFGTSVDAMFG